MALIKCPECGSLISNKATKCPKCGCQITIVGERAGQKETSSIPQNISLTIVQTVYKPVLESARKPL